MSSSCLKNIENYWKLKTEYANKLFLKGSYDKALEEYKQALYKAEVLNNNTNNCEKAEIPFIQVYVISCNNITNTHMKLGEVNQAVEMIKRSIYYLLYLAKENIQYIQEIQSELRKMVIHYFTFCKKYSQSPEDELIMMLKKSL